MSMLIKEGIGSSSMFNRTELNELGHFKVLMRQELKQTIKIERFMEDEYYRAEVLRQAYASSSEELIFVALNIVYRHRLNIALPDYEQKPSVNAERYMMRA